MKKLLALLLSLTFVLACFAGCGKSACEKNGHQYLDGACTVCGEYNPDPTYTQRTTMALSPTTWNPFTYQSTNDSLVLDYTTAGFYEYDYIDVNDPAKGFDIVPSMAAADPVDVTANYVGNYGVEEGDSGKAFRVALKEELCFDDGTPITAHTYVESFKLLLDSEMANSRASNYYTSSPAIVGAKEFAQSGWQKWMGANIVYSDDNSYSSDLDSDLYFTLTYGGYEGAKSEVWSQLEDVLTDNAIDPSTWSAEKTFGAVGWGTFEEGTFAPLEGKKISEIKADASLSAILDQLLTLWQEGDAGVLDFAVMYGTLATVEYDGNVGVIAVDNHTLDIIYNNEIVGFYIKYQLGLPLVHVEKYKASISVDNTTGAKSSNYGTSYETYEGCSYGPYKLAKYVADQQIVFTRNDSYFAYLDKYADEYGSIVKDGKTYRQYQTDTIIVTKATEIDTREQMFLAGQIDAFGMNAAKLKDYSGSEDLIYTEGYSTFYGIINGDYEALRAREIKMNGGDENSKKYVNTILSIKEFRQALNYAINREELVRTLYPAGTAAFGLYSDGIVADPAAGKAYHSFDESKEAMCRVWGIEYGEGKAYATLDEAYNAIRGYDLKQAKELLEVAVTKAKELGYMDDSSTVRIFHNESSDSSTSKLWHATFESWFLQLVEGTSLDGKFEYVYDTSLGDAFGEAIRSGVADCAWGFGWNGSALDPWGLAEVYVDSAHGGSYQYDPYNNFAQIYPAVTIAVDFGEGEKDYTFNLDEWWAITVGNAKSAQTGQPLPNGAFGKIADSYRAKILAKIEECILLQYCTIPIMNEGSVQLNSYKVQYYHLDDYVYGIGYGGLRYMTYAYNDVEWKEFVRSQGGTLNYKG